jgi:hypothetical protein
MSKGSVYILQNPALAEDMLKIGRTKRKVEQRAQELFTTGLPEQFYIRYEQDVPDCILAEKLIHQRLKQYRYRSDREFFVLPLQEAISITEDVLHSEFSEISSPICPGNNNLNKGTTFRWSCHSNSIIILFRYMNWLDSKPTIANFWGCKTKDHILLTTRQDDDPSKLIKLANDAHLGGSLSEVIKTYPGDRLVVIDSPIHKDGSQQLSLFESKTSVLEPKQSIISIVDCLRYGKMVGFMENIEIHSDGFPIPFGDCFDDKPPAIVYEAMSRVIKMGVPDVYPNYEYIQERSSGL